MKGLIVCAGKGQRLRPFTLTQPKTLLPVANTPILFYAIEKLAGEGIQDIGIVIHPSQEMMIRKAAGDGEKFGVSLTYLYQQEPRGIADAVAAAEAFIGLDDFILLLGDNLVKEPLRTLIDRFEQSDASILLTSVDNPEQFGVAEIKDNRIVSLEEKPPVPRSNLAVVGIYAFSAGIFDHIRNLKPSGRGEYEITDAIQSLILSGRQVAFALTHQPCSDVGTSQRWLAASRWMMDELCGDANSISSGASLVGCTVRAPVVIGSGSTLRNCIIGPYVAVMPGARLEDCHIEHSILLSDVVISGTGAEPMTGIFGENASIIRSSVQGSYLPAPKPALDLRINSHGRDLG
ncbi:NTP transferase domain-containing protein [Paenibacillus sp. HN-1]|uniref:sugar phosphate nucleotidyltransferase n=1 Tax=Paenibacillus TaxID=44249 RepID=UPI001CA838AD|nr:MULTISPECIES: sugar phosphate nucleotidyltransferase [Paenibacillus]MBY9078656.1 NTP transferase domain-containing protein [Paenibacillus sp. CGMCC 1.18879]MBY9084192.1 NTP transferase domain-containing protein [Paenibacillus sinensis]